MRLKISIQPISTSRSQRNGSRPVVSVSRTISRISCIRTYDESGSSLRHLSSLIEDVPDSRTHGVEAVRSIHHEIRTLALFGIGQLPRQARRIARHRAGIFDGRCPASDERSARAASSRPDHAPLLPKACSDRPCHSRSYPEMPLRSQALLLLRKSCEPPRRHRKPGRQLPRTAWPWLTFPSRSSRSAQGLSFRSRHLPHHQDLNSHRKQPLASQKCEQWQQRQTENGEVISFNPFKQMNP